MTEEEKQDLTEKLTEYCDMEGTEIGELCEALIWATYYPEYMSNEFEQALEKELLAQLKNFEENYTITEEEKTYTTKRKVLKHK
jgi:hypothetical protein